MILCHLFEKEVLGCLRRAGAGLKLQRTLCVVSHGGLSPIALLTFIFSIFDVAMLLRHDWTKALWTHGSVKWGGKHTTRSSEIITVCKFTHPRKTVAALKHNNETLFAVIRGNAGTDRGPIRFQHSRSTSCSFALSSSSFDFSVSDSVLRWARVSFSCTSCVAISGIRGDLIYFLGAGGDRRRKGLKRS